MSVEHTSRTGKRYYLHVKTTAAGKPNYFFSTDSGGPLAEQVPEGYEIHENVGGQVFLRKATPQIIRPEELAVVEDAVPRREAPWRYRVEVKKNMIVVYDAGNMAGMDDLYKELAFRPATNAEKLRRANYMALLRFTLVDKKSRTFTAERFCFRGSVDDWIPIAGPGTLASHVRQFMKHLGQESFYELF